MNWLIPLGLAIAFESVLLPIAFKLAADTGSRVRRQRIAFLAALVACSVFLLINRKFGFHFWFFAIGVANGLGFFAYLKAIKHSLSLTHLAVAPLANLLALALGFIYLREHIYVQSQMVTVGLTICCAAALLGLFREWRRPKTPKEKGHFSWWWLVWVLGVSCFWGVALYSLRYFSVNGKVPLTTFLPSWYLGSCLGTVVVFFLVQRYFDSEDDVGAPLTPFGRLAATAIGLGMFGNMLFHKWSAALVPLTVSVPASLALGSLFPLLLGRFVFREVRKLGFADWAIILLALIGVVLLVSGFQWITPEKP